MRDAAKLRLQALVARSIGWIGRRPDALRILTYHSVQQSADCGRHMPPVTFESQVRHLAEAGYQTLRVCDVVSQWPGVLRRPRCVVLTFDDGYANHRAVVAEILGQYGMTGTFFVPTAFIGAQRSRPGGEAFRRYGDVEMASWEDLRELAAAGFEVGAHSHSHVMVARQSRQAAQEEIRVPKRMIEDRLETVVKSFAYPKGHAGAFADWTREVIAEAGYEAACTMVGGCASPCDDVLELPRIGIQPTDGLDKFRLKLGGYYDVIGRRHRRAAKRWVREAPPPA